MAGTESRALAKSFAKTIVGLLIGIAIAALAIRATGVTGEGILSHLAHADPLKLALGAVGGFVLTAAQAVCRGTAE